MNIKSIICKIRGYHKIDHNHLFKCKTCGKEAFSNNETIQVRYEVKINE